MAAPRRKCGKSRKGMRRSHHALKRQLGVKCTNCGEAVLGHRACSNCGFYKGRDVEA